VLFVSSWYIAELDMQGKFFTGTDCVSETTKLNNFN
jgi:hypothetical protein